MMVLMLRCMSPLLADFVAKNLFVHVAISNRRLIACDDKGVTFKWKDYRLEGRERYQVMTLATDELIRRFLIHVLPAGFHRIRYYGLLARGKRAENIARARELLTLPVLPVDAIKTANITADEAQTAKHACPRCGGRMLIIERFERGSTPPITGVRQRQ
jgi:DNA-directed RNA polymerase subunit RPC12/RpoP